MSKHVIMLRSTWALCDQKGSHHWECSCGSTGPMHPATRDGYLMAVRKGRAHAKKATKRERTR